MHEVAIAYSSETKNSAGRLNRSLLDMVRTMMLSGIETKKELYAEAAHNACFIRNTLM